jgi:hypothetical protein
VKALPEINRRFPGEKHKKEVCTGTKIVLAWSLLGASVIEQKQTIF